MVLIFPIIIMLFIEVAFIIILTSLKYPLSACIHILSSSTSGKKFAMDVYYKLVR